jgi:hypothetical protein
LSRHWPRLGQTTPTGNLILLNRPEDILQMGYENIVLFERGFAQAFWGEAHRIVVPTDSGDTWSQDLDKPAWRYHLQELAVAPDLFAYLAKFL